MSFMNDPIKLTDIAPAGHYLAVRVGFAFPMFEQNELPQEWVKTYTKQGLMLHDPVMKWVYSNAGSRRWSALEIDDPRNVLRQASEFSLNFGVAVSYLDEEKAGLRSFGSFARSDREFTDSEINDLSAQIQSLHNAKEPPQNLTNAEKEVLAMVKDGLLLKEMAAILGVSEGAIKQRLKNAKQKLGAKTSAHAAALSLEYGLI